MLSKDVVMFDMHILEINECHPQYYRDGLTLNHEEMANMYQYRGSQ